MQAPAGTTTVISVLARNREMIAACVGAMLEFLVVAMSGLLVSLMALDLGATAATIGVLVSVSGVGSLAAAVPAGMLLTRFGARPLVLISCLVAGASCLYIYLVPTLTSLFIGLTVFGIGWTVFAVAVQCYIGSIGGEGRSSSNFGWYGTSVAIGQMIGPLLSGILIDTAGKGVAWLTMATIVTATGAGMYLAMGPASIEAPGTADRPAAGRLELKELFTPLTAVGIISSFVILFALGVRSTFLPVLLAGAGYSASLIGGIDSVRGLTSVFARLSIGPALRLFGGRFTLLTCCQLVLAAGLAAIPLCVSVPTLIANAIIIGVGFGVAIPISQAIVFDGAPPARRGVAMGLRMTGNRVAQMASPLLFGLLITGSDMTAAFVASGVLLLLMTSPMLVWWARSRRVTGSAPAL